MKNPVVYLILIFLVSASVVAEKTVAGNAGNPYSLLPAQYDYDAGFYGISLDVDMAARFIRAEVEVAGTIRADATDRIVLNLRQNMQVDSVIAAGQSLAFTHQNQILTVILPQPLNVGAPFRFTVYYTGYPMLAGTPGYGLIFTQHAGKKLAYSYNWPYFASTFIPCKDHPSDKVDSVQMAITVPDTFQVACNGRLIGSNSLPGNRRQYVWRHHYPIVPYNLSINIYPYRVTTATYTSPVSGPVDLNYFIFPDHAATVEPRLQAVVPQIFEAFESRYGPFPFAADKYGLCESVFGGGMEHQTILTMNDQAFMSDIVVHESSHEYFGNMISLADWGHIWLNEGFATFSEALFHEYWDGDSAYTAKIREFMAGSGEGKIFVDDPSIPNNIIPYNLVYLKAAVVIHMLRFVMGENRFWTMIHDYVTSSPFRYKNIDTHQFQLFCQNYYGGDLGWFFDQWIYGDGKLAGNYTYYWSPQKDSLYFKARSLPSHPGGTVHAMPVPLQIQTLNAAWQDTVWIDSLLRSRSWALTDSTGLSVTVDPDDRILKGVLAFKAAPELTAAYLHAGSVSVTWAPFFDFSRYHLRVWRLDAGGNSVLVGEYPVDGFTYIFTPAEQGTYRFAVAGEQNGYITAFSDYRQVNYTLFPMDQGILVVDETRNGNGSNMLDPSDAAVDAFYDSLLQGLPHQQFDVIQENRAPDVFDLAPFSAVLWHHEVDYPTVADESEPELQAYLDAGGTLIFSGMKYLNRLSGPFRHDFLGIDQVQTVSSPEFSAAEGSYGYPDLPVDSAKITIPFYHHLLANVSVFDSVPASRTIYHFLAGPAGSAQAGKPVGVRQTVSGGAGAFTLGFPLYFIRQDSAAAFLRKALRSSGNPLLLSAREPVAGGFELVGCYPNPFNPVATIVVRLGTPQRLTATVYNLLGQRIKTIFNGRLPAGEQTLTWNGKNTSGKDAGSGVYFVALKAGNRRIFSKIILQR